MCYDVPCTLVPVSSWFRFSLASSSDHWNSRFAKKTLEDMDMLQCSGSPLHVSFWPAHPGRDVFGKLMQPQHPGTRSKDKQRRNTSHDITCHTEPYWAILGHIGPYWAMWCHRHLYVPSLQQHNGASTLQWCSCCPWIQHASTIQLPQTRNCWNFAWKLLQARYIPVLPEPGSENCEIPSTGKLLLLPQRCNRGIGIFSANAYASHTLVPTRVALPTEPWLFYAFLTWGLDFKLAKFSIFMRIDKCTHDCPSILLIPNIAWHVYCTHCFSQVFFDLCFAFKLWWFFGQCSCSFPSLPEQHCPSFPTPLSWCGRAPPGWQQVIKMT